MNATPDEDDLLPELPDDDVTLGDDLPPADDELGLEGEIDLPPDENGGLDDAAGLDDEPSGYLLDLPPDDDVTDEDGVDAIPVEGLDGDDEYGWTDDPRSAKEDDSDWEGTLDLPELTPLTRDDGGEEGVEDLVQLGGNGDEVPHLGPLHADEEDDDELFFDDDARLRAFEEGPLAFGIALEPPACRVEPLGGGSMLSVSGGLAGGRDGLFAARARLERVSSIAPVLSLAVDPSDAHRVVVGTPEGALRSIDGGATFAPANGWAEGRDAAQPFFVACESAARLWGRTAGGALFRSDDFGASWTGPLLLKPVVALTATGECAVALCAGRNVAPQIARSEDGGQRWTASDGPPLAPGAVFLAVARDFVAVTSGAGPFLSADRGRSWTRIPGLPETGAIALAMEPGGLAVYAAHATEGGVLVARHRPGGGEPALLLQLDGEEVRALTAERAGERTVLHVASSEGLYRATVDPDRIP